MRESLSMIYVFHLTIDGLASDVVELSADELSLEASSAHRLQGNGILVSPSFSAT